MANRTFDQYFYTIPKTVVGIYATIAVPSGTTPVLQKYNFPVFGVGGRTYTAATTSATAPLGYPNNYSAGTEGVFSVARTAVGLWTLTLQDKYQRILMVSGSHSIAGGTTNIMQVTENPTITNLANATGQASIVGIALLSATGALADPTAGATSLIRIRLDLADATEG